MWLTHLTTIWCHTHFQLSFQDIGRFLWFRLRLYFLLLELLSLDLLSYWLSRKQQQQQQHHDHIKSAFQHYDWEVIFNLNTPLRYVLLPQLPRARTSLPMVTCEARWESRKVHRMSCNFLRLCWILLGFVYFDSIYVSFLNILNIGI